MKDSLVLILLSSLTVLLAVGLRMEALSAVPGMLGITMGAFALSTMRSNHRA